MSVFPFLLSSSLGESLKILYPIKAMVMDISGEMRLNKQ